MVEVSASRTETSADKHVSRVQVDHAVLAEGLGQGGAEPEDAVFVDLSLLEDVAAAADASGDPPSRRLRQHHGRCEFPGHDEIGVPIRPYC